MTQPLRSAEHVRRASRSDMLCRFALLIVLTGSFIVAMFATVQEWRIHRADARLAAIDGDLNYVLPLPDQGAWLEPPRAAISEALAQSRIGATDTDARTRARRIAGARQALWRAERGRPGWALVPVTESFLDVVEGGANSAAAARAFCESYRRARFLHDAAPWRIRYGLDHWARLDGDTRRHIVDEAAWYSSLRGGYIGTMTALVGHPAEVAVMRERADIARTRRADDED